MSESLTERAATLRERVAEAVWRIDLDSPTVGLPNDGDVREALLREADAMLAVVWPEIYAAIGDVRERKDVAFSNDAGLDALEAEIKRLAGD